MGDQSSGKSSVLEAISGVPLPRGGEIVTRCPLEMRLERSDTPWFAKIEFTSKNKSENWTLTSKEEVSLKIEEATNLLAGDGQDVSDQLIRMSIRSPDCPNLTLIDLPGLVHSVVKNQSDDLIQCIEDLIIKYMSQEKTIMLCVYPANMDFSNCGIFHMANKYDPQGKRTIGIITKPDLVNDHEQKQRLCERMQEGVYNLKQFYIVKSRTPQELRDNISREELFQREKKFFASDQIYRGISKNMKGYPILINVLSEKLISAIRHGLPGLRGAITKKLKETQRKFEALPPPPPQSDEEKTRFLMMNFHEFLDDVEEALHHGLKPCKWYEELDLDPFEEPDEKKLVPTMFAVWHRLFDEYMSDIVEHTKNQFENEWSLKTLKIILQGQRGEEVGLFPNFPAFKALIINDLNYHSNLAKGRLLSTLESDLKEFIRQSANSYFSSHPQLHEEVKELCLSVVKRCVEMAKERIQHIFEMEKLTYSQDKMTVPLTEKNLASTTYCKKCRQHRETCCNVCHYQPNKEISRQWNEDYNVEQMQDILKTYLKIVNNRIGDYVPCALRVCLHIEFSSILNTTLLASVSKAEMQSAIVEADAYKEDRVLLCHMLERLRKGEKSLSVFNFSSCES